MKIKGKFKFHPMRLIGSVALFLIAVQYAFFNVFPDKWFILVVFFSGSVIGIVESFKE
jgi:hypothetical protein